MSHILRTGRLSLGGAMTVCLTTLASADVVHLRSGGRVEGVLVSSDAARTVVLVSVGRVTLPQASILRIDRSESPLARFRRRAEALSLNPTVAGWTELALFAREFSLRTQEADAWRQVLFLDPDNAAANEGLGRHRFRGAWMEGDEANRARGLVLHEGRWVTPEEQASLLRQREREADGERRLKEAREAARAAEERARQAEAAAARARAEADTRSGLFLGGFGGYAGYPSGMGYPPCVGPSCAPPRPRASPNPEPSPLTPIPPIPRSSIR